MSTGPAEPHTPRGGVEAHRVQDQSQVEAFLALPVHHDGAAPDRIDTHGATLFLGPRHVLKIKKAVRYPYLDFSTLERRHAAIRRELERGRDIAPSIYVDVLAVTREADGTLALGGGGEPVEWVVRMNRFKSAGELTRWAQAGRISGALADSLGRQVAAMHADAEPREGGSEAIGAVMRENFGSLAEFPELFAHERVETLATRSEAAFASVAGLLDARGRSGLVRLCHGDLHLGNIVMLDGVPTPFDAIEFDDGLATTDTFYDLAYLLMDLWERGLRDAANRVLCAYLDATGDDEGLAALPLFLSVRAAIRAKVNAAAGRGTDARKYFAWSLRFLETRPARLVAVGGLSGTGKTTVARAIAPDIGPAPGAVLVRTDAVRKSLAGVAETDRLAPSAYTEAARRRVYAAVQARARTILAAGHAAIVDAVNARPDERAALEAIAAGSGVGFSGLWLEAPAETLLARVAGRAGDASDADAAVVRRQFNYEVGAVGWARVDASGAPDEVAGRAAAAIGPGSPRST